jgi:hypothetical protein
MSEMGIFQPLIGNSALSRAIGAGWAFYEDCQDSKERYRYAGSLDILNGSGKRYGQQPLNGAQQESRDPP